MTPTEPAQAIIMRTAVLIHDRVYIEVQINGWTPLLPLLAKPGARPGVLCKSVWSSRELDIFIPFDRKIPYNVENPRRRYPTREYVIISYPAEETTKPNNWKKLTRMMGMEKQKFVEEHLGG